MSDLTFAERTKLEHLLGMGNRYVLNFSNRTFTEFVVESTSLTLRLERASIDVWPSG